MTEYDHPPAILLESLPRSDRTTLRLWWRSVPTTRRAELHRLFDPRHEDIGTAPSDEGWEPLPIRLQGRTVEDPELGPETRQAKQQMLEFILNHEEIAFFLEERQFHICRAHAQAKSALVKGVIPARFRCTLRGENCPMRAISKAANEAPVLVRLRCATTS